MRFHTLLLSTLILVVNTAMVSCQSTSIKTEHLDAIQFNELLTATDAAQLVDVRTAEEYNGGHIEKAINIDWRNSGFVSSVESLDKEKPVFVYCLSGGRSASAARKLKSLGFQRIYNLNGGILAWKDRNLPLEGYTAKKGMSLSDYKTLTKAETPVLVNFFAPWCGPCKKMKPMLEELHQEDSGKFKYVKLNADNNDALMKELNVNEIPTFFIYKNGNESWKHVGLVVKDTLAKELGL